MTRGWIYGTVAAVALIAATLLVFVISGEHSAGGELLPEPELPERRIRVEVLNAAGAAGLARTATNRLRDRGFDVVFYGNTRSFSPDTSYVFDRVGEPAIAREVADALGIPRVASRPDPDLYLEVTVVLGRDWEDGRVEAPPDAAEEASNP